MICRNHVDVTEGIRRCARCQTPFCRSCLVEIQGRPYCATCKSEQLLDIRSGVTTGSRLDYAGVWKRFAAILVDGLLLGIPYYAIALGIALTLSEKASQALPYINFLGLPLSLIQILYEGLMLSNKNGQTLGKLAMRVRVVRPDGSSISAGQAWGRVAMKVILGFFCFITYFPALFTDEKTTLHDMVAGTRVVEIL